MKNKIDIIKSAIIVADIAIASIIMIGGLFLFDIQGYNSLKNKVKQNPEKYEVQIESYKTVQRDQPLFTKGIIDCGGLILDSKKSNKHYLGHFSSCDDWQKVRDSITNTFPNPKTIGDLEVTLIYNIDSNSTASQSILTALEKLDLKTKSHRIRNDEVIIKSGRIYRDYF